MLVIVSPEVGVLPIHKGANSSGSDWERGSDDTHWNSDIRADARRNWLASPVLSDL